MYSRLPAAPLQGCGVPEAENIVVFDCGIIGLGGECGVLGGKPEKVDCART